VKIDDGYDDRDEDEEELGFLVNDDDASHLYPIKKRRRTGEIRLLDIGRRFLEKEQFFKYLQGTSGGKRAVVDQITIANRVISFTLWCFLTFYKRDMSFETDDFNNCFHRIITEDPEMLSKYADHLDTVLRRRPTTVNNTIHHIMLFANWFVLFRPKKTQYPNLKSDSLSAMNCLTKNITRIFNRQRKRELALTADKKDLIFLREMPKDGLIGLANCVKGRLIWANNLLRRKGVVITEGAYREFMQLLFSSLYVYAPQGRISGIIDLKYGDKDRILSAGYATSSQFKTSASFGFQQVIFAKIPYDLFKFYINCLYPVVQQSNPNSSSPLWLKWSGIKENKIGNLVTKFFEKFLNLHINSTRIRGLVETETDELLQKGEITTSQRRAVLNLNTHSGATSQKHYQKSNRCQDMLESRNVFRTLVDAEYPDTVENIAHLSENHEYADWGASRKDQGKTTTRAMWTAEEIDFIGRWCVKSLGENPEWKKSISSRCLKYIKSEGLNKALSIFHHRHILSSDRFRIGFKAAKKQYKF